jgi:hypothetical protein
MYEIDTSRTDLVEEFRNNPSGPYSSELSLVVNRLRLMPMADRHILVCTESGRRWVLAKMPTVRGAKVGLIEDQAFDNHNDGVWAVFKMRWQTVTGQSLS